MLPESDKTGECTLHETLVYGHMIHITMKIKFGILPFNQS